VTPLDSITIPLCGTNLIEASAGTGKTYAITNLYLRLLLELRLSVSQILVVTYTNAATAELRSRVRRRLRDALAAFDSGGGSGDEFLDRLVRRRLAQGTLDQDRVQLIVALHGFDEAAIFTIHGFCQRMLQENAFESGVVFDTELISNQGPLVTEVVQDFWVRELHNAPQAVVRRLAEHKTTPTTLEHVAMTAIAHPDTLVLPGRDEAVGRGVQKALASGRIDDQLLDGRVLELKLDLVAYARLELRRRKEQARIQSFDDLLQRFAEALRGAGGGLLAEMIRRRFRAALVDEFQDTDPIQYEIFRRLYLGSDAVLFLIGDPKQAIYAFRGADVFAYLQAKRDVGGQPHTLGVNQRSDPSLIEAVTALFGRLRSPFLFDDIPLPPVEPAPHARDHLGGTAAGQPPLQILFVRRAGQESSKDGFINKPWGDGPLARAVATDIVRFLRSGATIGDRPVEPGDIAVLCRKNKQASLMQQALRQRGVPSVLQSEATVFEAPEAEEIERVLRAMADPGDTRAVRAALSTTLLGQNAQQLAALEHDEQRWDAWIQHFQAWHDRWTQRSFVAALRELLDAQGVPQRLLGLLDGERRLTNVLHLMELLHTASTEERRGPHALVHWLNQMRTDADARAALAGEAAQIRLESDEAAVKLTTVHKSKGLQYPIVYCPHLWEGARLSDRDKEALCFHSPQGTQRLTLDIGSGDHRAHAQLAEREAFAENLRLLYVALTRAQHRCTLVWGPFRSAESSALGYVLHQPAEVGEDPKAATADRIEALVRSGDNEVMRAELEARAAAAPGCIGVADLPAESPERYTPSGGSAPALHCRTTTREMRRTWRVSSFSAMASSGTALSQPAEEGLDHDAPVDTAAPDEPPEPAAGYPLVALHDFPAGTRAGQLIHEVLQQLDFQTPGSGAMGELAAAALAPVALAPVALARHGFEPEWAEPLCRAIADVIATPLDDRPDPLTLARISRDQRLNELEFMFPIADQETAGSGQPAVEGLETSARHSGALLTSTRLAAVFARHATAPFPADYAGRLRSLGFAPLAGFLRGFIDLVFEHQGRWYIADYKSNRLGVRPGDYRASQLAGTMAEHHYILQYHLYAIALHRHLTRRLAGYHYDRHFGGVYYLFVRGMAPHYERGNGVFFDRPARALIESLSAVLAGHPEAA
jgi:exodeoxyribonuclease V beta subunit